MDDLRTDVSVAVDVFAEVFFEAHHEGLENLPRMLHVGFKAVDTCLEAGRPFFLIADLRLLDKIPEASHDASPSSVSMDRGTRVVA